MPNDKCGMTMIWYKNLMKKLILNLYKLFIVFSKLMFCKAVSRRVVELKSLIAKWKIILYTQVSDQCHFIISLGNWKLKKLSAIEIEEVDMHNIRQTAQVLFREVKL